MDSCNIGLEEKKGILELMWGDKKCERKGFAPHQVEPGNCGGCPDFDGEAICNWHREHSSEVMNSGKTINPYMGFGRKPVTVFLSGSGKCELK